MAIHFFAIKHVSDYKLIWIQTNLKQLQIHMHQLLINIYRYATVYVHITTYVQMLLRKVYSSKIFFSNANYLCKYDVCFLIHCFSISIFLNRITGHHTLGICNGNCNKVGENCTFITLISGIAIFKWVRDISE